MAIDNEGVKVWERELDIYGKVRKETKETPNFVPFRYQGQYYDNEVDLCYNRFRYYDPNSGNYISQDPISLKGGNPTLYGYVKDTNIWIDVFGLHEVLSDNDIVARGGTCSAENFINGAEANNNGVLEGISTQAKPNANIETLSKPFKNGKVGTTTVSQIEKAGGEIILDGVLNSTDGKKMANHATINGLTGEELERLFREGLIDNPIPKENRGCS